MGKRSRKRKARAAKRRKVAFAKAVTTREVPASNPRQRPAAGARRTRGGKGGERQQFAAAQRGLGEAELLDEFLVAHCLEDIVRQVQADVTAEREYTLARNQQLTGPYGPASIDPAFEEARKARRLPRQQREERVVVDLQNPLMLNSLPRRPGRCACYCCRRGVFDGKPFCAHRRCCRRWRRALPKVRDGYENSTDEESDDEGCLPSSLDPCGGAPAAAEPEDAFDAPSDGRGMGWLWDDDDGFDRNGFPIELDLAADDPIMLLFNRGASTSGAPASDSGTSRSTSSDSDDSDVDYSRWDVDADTQDFYDDHGFELEAQHLYETRRTSVD